MGKLSVVTLRKKKTLFAQPSLTAHSLSVKEARFIYTVSLPKASRKELWSEAYPVRDGLAIENRKRLLQWQSIKLCAQASSLLFLATISNGEGGASSAFPRCQTL